MVLALKTAASVNKSLLAMLENRAERHRLRPLLEILGALIQPGGAYFPGFVTSPYGRIRSRNGDRCYETHRDPEPSFITWKVRWYQDDDTIWIIDIQAQ